MYTGIVEEIGTIVSLRRTGGSARLRVHAPLVASDAAIGDSISISGVCLTVVERAADELEFDAVPETVNRSSLSGAAQGDQVNLERSIPVGGRMGGHFVLGHVDGVGKFVQATVNENAHVMSIQASRDLMRYIALKGSVCVDGASLTVASTSADGFTVWVIPHTWQNTVLFRKHPGDPVNIEVDVLARYTEHLLSRGQTNSTTMERLAEAGFLDG